ncbi:hypothetical protein [Cellulomonas sp. NS3]|uniref:hypothetical protein n=1 Tax=Cellulomonas sp. NS3 TaxID=2973977 RepID=UPI0021614E41|nr:hypothetical protein [Cellulomonas sp. NS3]
MVAAIVDIAHVLSTGLVATGDFRGAILTATHGLLAESCSETLYVDAIRAARASGAADEAERLSDQLRATLEALDPEYAS